MSTRKQPLTKKHLSRRRQRRTKNKLCAPVNRRRASRRMLKQNKRLAGMNAAQMIRSSANQRREQQQQRLSQQQQQRSRQQQQRSRQQQQRSRASTSASASRSASASHYSTRYMLCFYFDETRYYVTEEEKNCWPRDTIGQQYTIFWHLVSAYQIRIPIKATIEVPGGRIRFDTIYIHSNSQFAEQFEIFWKDCEKKNEISMMQGHSHIHAWYPLYSQQINKLLYNTSNSVSFSHIFQVPNVSNYMQRLYTAIESDPSYTTIKNQAICITVSMVDQTNPKGKVAVKLSPKYTEIQHYLDRLFTTPPEESPLELVENLRKISSESSTANQLQCLPQVSHQYGPEDYTNLY